LLPLVSTLVALFCQAASTAEGKTQAKSKPELAPFALMDDLLLYTAELKKTRVFFANLFYVFAIFPILAKVSTPFVMQIFPGKGVGSRY